MLAGAAPATAEKPDRDSRAQGLLSHYCCCEWHSREDVEDVCPLWAQGGIQQGGDAHKQGAVRVLQGQGAGAGSRGGQAEGAHTVVEGAEWHCWQHQSGTGEGGPSSADSCS